MSGEKRDRLTGNGACWITAAEQALIATEIDRVRRPSVPASGAQEASACTNGPDEYGNWPCDRGEDDSCTVCGWTPAARAPKEETR